MNLLSLVLIAFSESKFPVPGKYFARVPGGTFYVVRNFLDSGSSSRVYAADLWKPSLKYPLQAVVKFFCPAKKEDLFFAEQEMRILGKLNRLNLKTVVRGYYLSDVIVREVDSHSRYLIISRTGKDFDRIMSTENKFNSPILEGIDPKVTDKIILEPFVASVGLILLDTIRKIHEAGVTHGDLFSYNIALSHPDGSSVVVIDFGGGQEKDILPEQKFKDRVRSDEHRYE